MEKHNKGNLPPTELIVKSYSSRNFQKRPN